MRYRYSNTYRCTLECGHTFYERFFADWARHLRTRVNDWKLCEICNAYRSVVHTERIGWKELVEQLETLYTL